MDWSGTPQAQALARRELLVQALDKLEVCCFRGVSCSRGVLHERCVGVDVCQCRRVCCTAGLLLHRDACCLGPAASPHVTFCHTWTPTRAVLYKQGGLALHAC